MLPGLNEPVLSDNQLPAQAIPNSPLTMDAQQMIEAYDSGKLPQGILPPIPEELRRQYDRMYSGENKRGGLIENPDGSSGGCFYFGIRD